MAARVLAAAAVAAAAALLGTPAHAQTSRPEAPSVREVLDGARTWGYQLQDITLAPLAASEADVLVIDAGTPAPGAQLAKSDIERLKRKRDGSRRVVLAYLNLGEAESYRYYWKKAWEKAPPAWMGAENCRWRGDHRVRHWAGEWQAILFGSDKSYLGRIQDAGFDGVWLDRVDIFYYWRGERWQAAADMVDLVVRLSQWAKGRRPGFLVVPQNGEELYSDARFLAAIDGAGKEDMLFGDRGNDVANDAARIARAERNFAPVRAGRRSVLAVEYVRDKEKRRQARERLFALGFLATIAPRSLSSLDPDASTHKEDADTEPTLADAGDDGCG